MGIVCNLCQSDDPEKTKAYFEMGVDTILTNKYLKNASVLKKRK